jgi:hypothetical protein
VTESCSACRFHVKDNAAYRIGACHRHAPSIPLVVRLQPRYSDQPDAAWPMTRDTEWCGDYERATEKPLGAGPHWQRDHICHDQHCECFYGAMASCCNCGAARP